MRVYIIGNDGITLCRKAPATVNDGEIAVASNEDLHAAPLSGKRLLATVERSARRRKATEIWRPRRADRSAVVGESKCCRNPEPQCDPEAPLEAGRGDAMLRRPEGATVGGGERDRWQRHTVRGVFSGTLKKKLGLILASAKEERGRVYRIAEPASL